MESLNSVLSFLTANWELVLTVLVGLKLGAVSLILGKYKVYKKNRVAFMTNGVLTNEEKAQLFDDLDSIITELWKVISGITPFKTWI